MSKSISSKNKQYGAVLVVSLIMLLILTLIGLSGTQATSLEEKMAGNVRDQNIAFQAAESTLLAAEQFILTNPTTSYQGNTLTPGLLDIPNVGVNAEPASYFASATWTDANSVLTTAAFGNSLGIPTSPRYIIKKTASIPATGAVGPQTVFKITARAVGNNSGTQIILQEVFVRTN